MHSRLTFSPNYQYLEHEHKYKCNSKELNGILTLYDKMISSSYFKDPYYPLLITYIQSKVQLPLKLSC